jgi:hypothetical protein
LILVSSLKEKGRDDKDGGMGHPIEISFFDEEPRDQPGKKWLGFLDLTTSERQGFEPFEAIDLMGELE